MNHRIRASQMPGCWRYVLVGCLLWVLSAVGQSAFAQVLADTANCPACAQIKASLDEARRIEKAIVAEQDKAKARRDALLKQQSLAEIERAELRGLETLIQKLALRDLEQGYQVHLLEFKWSECVAKNCPGVVPFAKPPAMQPTCNACRALAVELDKLEWGVFAARAGIAYVEAFLQSTYAHKLMADEMTDEDTPNYKKAREELHSLQSTLESRLKKIPVARAQLAACNRRKCVTPPPVQESEVVCAACQGLQDRIDELASALTLVRADLAGFDREKAKWDGLDPSTLSPAEKGELSRIDKELSKSAARVKQLEERILALSAELETCVKEQCRPRTTPRVIIEQVIPRIGNAPFTPVRPGPTAVVPLPPQTPATPTPTPTPPPVATPQPTPPTPPVTPPAPPPTPQTGCASDFSSGNYICSGSCGIGSVNLSVTPGSSTMTANTLGANSGVVFSCSGSTASSQSSNLIILGAPGHRCNQIASGLSSFTESCSNAGGGTCSSTCSR